MPAQLVKSPLLIAQPWQFIGISRSAWFRLRAAGKTPAPVRVPGSGLRWRASDLSKFVEQLARQK